AAGRAARRARRRPRVRRVLRAPGGQLQHRLRSRAGEWRPAVRGPGAGARPSAAAGQEARAVYAFDTATSGTYQITAGQADEPSGEDAIAIGPALDGAPAGVRAPRARVR